MGTRDNRPDSSRSTLNAPVDRKTDEEHGENAEIAATVEGFAGEIRGRQRQAQPRDNGTLQGQSGQPRERLPSVNHTAADIHTSLRRVI